MFSAVTGSGLGKRVLWDHVLRGAKGLDPAKPYVTDEEHEFEFLRIIHVAVTFSKLTDRARKVCTKRPHFPL